MIFLLGALGYMMYHSDGQRTYECLPQRETPYHLIPVVIVVLAALMMGGRPSSREHKGIGSRRDLLASGRVAMHHRHHLAAGAYAVALHYARVYYDETAPGETTFLGGLDFPEQKFPDYWDFLYFSLTIAMCYQTSDVTSTTPLMRRLSLFHAVISFFFVTFVIGLVVGIVQAMCSPTT